MYDHNIGADHESTDLMYENKKLYFFINDKIIIIITLWSLLKKNIVIIFLKIYLFIIYFIFLNKNDCFITFLF